MPELGNEFTRIASAEQDPTSQKSGCLLLAMRATSLLLGMLPLLSPETRDSWDVLARAFMETRDLLLTFRFDDNGIRNSIETWFAGKNDGSWKARHKKAEAFAMHIGAGATELGKRWSAFSTLSHPTVHAARQSTSLVVAWVSGRSEDYEEAMNPMFADYLASIGSLIVAGTLEFPQWIPLGCDLSRMPKMEQFRLVAAKVADPVLAKNSGIASPPDSYRSQ